MEEYKPNSKKFKDEQKESAPVKKIEKVITGEARQRKKSELQKMTDVFISEDINNVKSYILVDVLIPAIKKAVSDIVTNGIDMLLYGETGNSKKSSSSRVSYRSYYEKENNRRDSNSSGKSRNGYNYDDIILDNRGEAEEVLTKMDEIISVYGVVSIADLYDLVDITSNYTDNKYGWTDIRGAAVVRIRNGYLIKLPRALPLN